SHSPRVSKTAVAARSSSLSTQQRATCGSNTMVPSVSLVISRLQKFIPLLWVVHVTGIARRVLLIGIASGGHTKKRHMPSGLINNTSQTGHNPARSNSDPRSPTGGWARQACAKHRPTRLVDGVRGREWSTAGNGAHHANSVHQPPGLRARQHDAAAGASSPQRRP